MKLVTAPAVRRRVCEKHRKELGVPDGLGSVGDIQQITEVFEVLDREFGKIDILANVAHL